MFARSVSPALLALTVLLTSCRKPEIQTYRVAKDPTAPTADTAATSAPAPQPATGTPAARPATPNAGNRPGGAGTSMAGATVATAGGPGLTWTAPPHWKPKPGSAMRKGSFAVAGDGGEADISITAFPGDAGGDLANLNRWRAQIKLPPVTQAEFEAAARRMEKNGLRMTVVDLVGDGTDAQRIMGAMIPHGGATWFVKVMGPDALVAKEKPAFLAFLETIKAPAAQ
ncbi:MAG: hypothetical protein ACREH8_04085 [Opitutaceae bacterium]